MTEREFNRIKHAQWREANPERARASRRAYYASDIERSRAKKRAYYAANAERINALSRARRAKERDV